MIAFCYGRFSGKNFTGVAVADPPGAGAGSEFFGTVISSLCTSGYSPRWCFSQEMERRRAAPIKKMPVRDAGPMSKVHTNE
jgi:hypothetical protein